MSFAVNRLARAGLFSAFFSGLIFLSACGGGSGSQSPSGSGNGGGNPPPTSGDSVPKVSLSGGGVKGPLAYAQLAFYEFDANKPDFQAASAVAIGETDSRASFSGVLVPAPNPPYILVFTANANTRDLTTGTSPVITILKTVVTEDMLSQGYPIYATPLTTLAVDLAIANANSTLPPYDFPKQTRTVDNFLLALPIAVRQVTSSVGFGISSEVDIFRTWPVVGTDSSAEALRVTAEYRSAVEAFSTLVYQMAQSAGTGTSTNQVMQALAADLGDGVIDGIGTGGQPIALLGTTQLDLLQNADPANLTIPNSSVLVGNVEGLLAAEAVIIGATADTTALADGTISVVLQPAELDPDRDGDGVMNVVDAFPADASRDTDTDGDGTADTFYVIDGTGKRTGAIDAFQSDPDDDNDGLSDAIESSLGTNPLLPDSDSDGVLDSVENTAFGNVFTLAYGVYAGTYSGTGTNPVNADSDADGVLDGVEAAASGAVVIITGGSNAGSYVGTGTNPLDNDTDNDGLNDGEEVEALTDPRDTDTDNDGYTDKADNCPAVSNANQKDTNGDGVGDDCSADLTGVWKLTFLPTSMTWNGCDKSLLDKSYTVYHSLDQNASGVLAATDHRGLGMSGNITVGSNRFTLSGTSSEANLYGTTTVRTLDLAARKNLDGGVSGSYVILDTINGTAICRESGDVSAAFVYGHSGGGEAYSGMYALEYVDNALPLRGAQTAAKQNSGLMQVAISGTGFEMHDYRAGSSVVSSSYDSVTGVFRHSTLHEEVMDLNEDGIDDLHRLTSDLTGIMVRAAGDASGATLVFSHNIKDATYYNYSVDPTVLPILNEQRRNGYGRPITPRAYNETVTRPGPNGTPVAVDRFGLANPPLQVATSGSALRLAAFAGTDTRVAPLCSTPFETALVIVENYPAADAAAEALRNGDYGDIACEAGPEGSVAAGGSYTLAVIDDRGTPLDTLDDQVQASFAHTAAVTSPAPATIPARSGVRMDGAGPSQTQIDPRIAIDGYFNPYAAHTFTWPDQGASGYRLRLWKLNTTEVKKEIRIDSATNSAVLPAGVMDDTGFTALELDTRFDAAGTSALATGRTLTAFPFINGLFNVEAEAPLSGDELNFQLALQRTDFDSALCTVTFSNRPLQCDSLHLIVNWDNDTIALHFSNPEVSEDLGFYLTFQFSDAANAAVTSDVYQGAARRVTTELVARNQVRADGTLGTVLTLENPPPLFSAGQLDSQSGTVDLGGGSTVLTLWDDTDLDPANDFTVTKDAHWEHPANDANPPAVATQLQIDSAALSGGSYVLPDGGYRVSLQNHSSQAMADMAFAVDVVAANTDAVRGPALAAMRVNGVAAGADSGDGIVTAIDVSAQSVFDLGWDAMAASSAQWAVVVRALDGTGLPIPGREWRTPFMDTTNAALVFTLPGTWSWTNTTLDLASYLAAGETAQVQLISRDGSGGLQGLSDSVYVRR
jgi:hypothetical protein